jgi:spore germination protein GerM
MLTVNKLLRSITLSLMAIVLFTACNRISDKQSKSKIISGPRVTVYYTQASDDLGVVLIPVYRAVDEDHTAYETAIQELFLGPTIDEQTNLKLNSEIPEGVRLIKVEESPEKVNINISSQFMRGGGSESIQIRFRQLRETALNLAKGRPVYLFVDGDKARTIGGEGLEVPQPLAAEQDEDK